MNVEEYNADLEYDLTESGMTSNFKSLNDGDTLIIHDSISDISYDETTDITTINFEYEQEGEEGEPTETLLISLIFEGNLTSEYSVDDEVTVTLTIKHITVTVMSMDLDLEIYEEYWENEQHFIDNYATVDQFKPITSDKISKV